MRIGIDARLWNETGVGRYIRNLVWQLEKLDKKNSYVLFVKQGIKKQSFDFAQDKNSRWKVVETSVHWHSLKEQLQFPKVLYKEILDVMHFPYFSHPVFYNRPFVVTIHDLIITHFPTGKASTLPYPLYRMKRAGYDFVIDHAIRKSSKIIVPLDAVKDDVLQTFDIAKERIAVTYEGVNANFKKQNTKAKEQNYFLYVGNAYPHKNLERLIEAFSEFKKESDNDVKLILVGKDDYFYKRLHATVEEKKLTDIIFKHNVSDEELSALYTNATAFVSASLMEGFGLPPLEAMAASCPVLLSDIPSFREVCQEAAYYFDPLSQNSLKQKLDFVYNLDHKIKVQNIGKGLKRVKQFSWGTMAKQTLAVYESSISIR